MLNMKIIYEFMIRQKHLFVNGGITKMYKMIFDKRQKKSNTPMPPTKNVGGIHCLTLLGEKKCQAMVILPLLSQVMDMVKGMLACSSLVSFPSKVTVPPLTVNAV